VGRVTDNGLMLMRHFLNLFELTADEITHLLDEAARLKSAHERGKDPPLLRSKVLGLVFEKPSLRTRVSFETGVAQLAGSTIFLNGSEVGLGQRESLPDIARTISQYVNGVVLRTFSHATIETFAAHASCPVINGLSDYSHPCQALGDLLTIQEAFGKLRGRTVVFVGDGNNVARSLAIGCGKLGMRFVLAAPHGYGFDEPFLARYRQGVPKGELLQNGDPAHAVRDADVIYTDVWTSMGQEAERDERLRHFAPYQVNAELLVKAPSHARVMHCLPAHRGEEVTSDVLDGERSIVFPQAANRMHAQKALVVWLLTEQKTKTKQKKPRTAAKKQRSR
jgi:ornithine carbamoyltransferase